MESLLKGWESFYVIVGSAGAALTGLMFVAMTLIAESEQPSSPTTVSAFATPTLVHFISPLILAAVLTAPWPKLDYASYALVASGAGGVAYSVIAAILERRQPDYNPEVADWLWFTALPLGAYAALTVAARFILFAPVPALFGVGAAALLLLLIAIHNAWDVVTYIAVVRRRKRERS